jgi:hypothetical protein
VLLLHRQTAKCGAVSVEGKLFAFFLWTLVQTGDRAADPMGRTEAESLAPWYAQRLYILASSALESQSLLPGQVPMTEWRQEALSQGITLSVPKSIARQPAHGIDTTVTLMSGNGITVLVDQGPFADPLTAYANRAEYRSTQEVIDGHPFQIVSFVDNNGTHVVAAHFAGIRTEPSIRDRLTIVVRVEPASVSEEEVAYSIIRSVKFGER